jgi:hypothetical protein
MGTLTGGTFFGAGDSIDDPKFAVLPLSTASRDDLAIGFRDVCCGPPFEEDFLIWVWNTNAQGGPPYRTFAMWQ